MEVSSVRLTNHAVERYRERLQRPLTFEQARQELRRLLPSGALSVEPPPWLQKIDPDVSGYWTIGDLCLVMQQRNIAVTCIVRGGLAPHVRARRNEDRRSRRYRLAKERGH